MDKKPTPKKPNLIYDVGLHRGQDTNLYLRRSFEAVVFEVEKSS